MSAERYLRHVEQLLRRLRRQRPAIRLAGRLVADAIDRGGVVHVFGTGHSHLIAEESFFRAGGLAAINPVLEPDFMFGKGAFRSTRMERKPGLAAKVARKHGMRRGDAGIVISNSGRNAAPVEMAIEMKKRGLPVIAITSLRHSRASTPRNPAGRRLFEVADLVLDNAGAVGDAAIRVRGLQAGATSTVAGAALIQAVMVEALAHLHEPAVFPSANAQAPADLSALVRPYRRRIRLYR